MTETVQPLTIGSAAVLFLHIPNPLNKYVDNVISIYVACNRGNHFTEGSDFSVVSIGGEPRIEVNCVNILQINIRRSEPLRQVGECIDGGGHAWNLVELDSNWYQMDVTWNDGGRVTDCLLVDDAYMQKSRYWETLDHPACRIIYVR